MIAFIHKVMALQLIIHLTDLILLMRLLDISINLKSGEHKEDMVVLLVILVEKGGIRMEIF